MNRQGKINFIRRECIEALGGAENNVRAREIELDFSEPRLADVLLAMEKQNVSFSGIAGWLLGERGWNLRANDLE